MLFNSNQWTYSTLKTLHASGINLLTTASYEITVGGLKSRYVVVWWRSNTLEIDSHCPGTIETEIHSLVKAAIGTALCSPYCNIRSNKEKKKGYWNRWHGKNLLDASYKWCGIYHKMSNLRKVFPLTIQFESLIQSSVLCMLEDAGIIEIMFIINVLHSVSIYVYFPASIQKWTPKIYAWISRYISGNKFQISLPYFNQCSKTRDLLPSNLTVGFQPPPHINSYLSF